MANLRNLNQQNPFWDWANSFDGEHGALPTRSAPWGHGPGAPQERGPSDPPESVPADEGGPHHHGHRHGSRSPHRHHGRGGHGHGPAHRGDGPSHRGRGRCGGRGGFGGPPPFGARGPFAGFGGSGNPPFDLAGLANWVQNNFINPQAGNGERATSTSQDFTPAIDIFAAEEAYIVHASLPGAAKEDIAVNWDAASSTLILTGVVHRPGDEALLNTMQVSERQVGAFERKVVLGTEAQPAKVDEDGISAKLEDGILRIEVPKLGVEETFVEVKKVDIE